jgi:bacterioferritin (cytochrome b1)
MLVSELQQLLRMTAFEQSIATVRRVQARSTDIAEELAANAEKSGERLALLAGAVKQVGGVPDVVGPLLGKAGAFVQTQLNQVQTLQGALLGDLTLEHQLRERARYARTLAESLGYSQVIPVLDRLETAHSATIEWLETRIAEVAKTGTSAIEATPIQAAVTTARKLLHAPFGVAEAGVNRVGGLVQRFGGKADKAVEKVVESAVDQVKDAAEDVAETASDVVAAVATSGKKATDDADVYPSAQGTVEVAVDEFGAVGSLTDNTGVEPDGVHAPFTGYEKLSGDRVITYVNESTDLPDLQVLLAFEEAHKNRKGVIQAVEARLADLGSPVS